MSLEGMRRIAHETAAPTRTVARFAVRYTQFLDEHGRLADDAPPIAHDHARLVELYRHMLLTRLFDRKAVALQRTGQLGTYASSLGQEATSVGIGAAMAREDVLLPTYRETGAMLLRGVEMRELLLYWGGDETGMDYSGPSAPREDFPICVPIATHAPHAVGVACAFKLRREPRVAVCALGDGATSKGDFYEALNAAGVFDLPLVFVIANNQWAISVPRRQQSRAETLAQKAIAAGIDGEQIDGNDLIAVYHATARALEKARSGGGPHVIEALTYRMHDHTTADDARRYRSEEELALWRARDPLKRVAAYLIRAGAFSEAQDAALRAELGAAVEKAVADYAATPARPPESMFDHLFERLPRALEPQREALASCAHLDGRDVPAGPTRGHDRERRPAHDVARGDTRHG
ncbi:MAG TPA: pyruvate dehydrogenase (acetyl-transferring) E1 component subunit alpha [Gammaproteobacteria bacterium]